MKYKFIVISAYSLFFAISGFGQKPYYDKAERNWTEEIPPTDKQPEYSIYLIGDAGQADFTKPSALKLLQSQLPDTGKKSSVVFFMLSITGPKELLGYFSARTEKRPDLFFNGLRVTVPSLTDREGLTEKVGIGGLLGGGSFHQHGKFPKPNSTCNGMFPLGS